MNNIYRDIDLLISYSIKKYQWTLSAESAAQIIKDEFGVKFGTVLTHCGVFQRDGKGNRGFTKFLASTGFKELI